MEYILLIGIEYKKYKKPAQVSVFLDSLLVDQFDLHQNHGIKTDLPIEKKWYDKFKMDNKLTNRRWKEAWAYMPQPTYYKCYRVPGNRLNDKLTIDVKNANSNYTNGFMTQSSTMRLPIIALFPSCLALHRGRDLMKAMDKIDSGFGILQSRTGRPEIGDDHRWGWPCTNGYNVNGKLVSWDVYMGGSFTAELNIRTRSGWKYLTFNHIDTGYPFAGTPKDLMLGSCTPILNMYNHEDQRSNS